MRNHPPTNRRSRTILPALAALGLAGVGLAQEPARPPATPASAPAAPAKVDPVIGQLVEAHNAERAREKLPPLKLEARLTEAALEHAKDMAEHEKMSHEGSDDSTPAQRVANAGYRYILTGENVAMGYRDVPEVMKGWMESPGHRHNIMGEFTEIGLARVVGKDDRPYWCANFGKPIPKLDPVEAAKDLVKRLNEEREAAKLPALEVDEKLAKAAREQAANLAAKKSPGGGTATFDGVDTKLYADLAASTARGQPDADEMVKVILAAADLKGQVLGKYSRIGTGYARSEDGIPYWCLILGNPARPAARTRR